MKNIQPERNHISHKILFIPILLNFLNIFTVILLIRMRRKKMVLGFPHGEKSFGTGGSIMGK